MNYYFISKLYDLKIKKSLSKGTRIDERMKISNGYNNFKATFENPVFIDAIGSLEFDSLRHSSYVYSIGDFKELKEQFGEKELNHVTYLNYFMRMTQGFLTALWLVKDNSIHLESGFLQTYPKKEYIKARVTSNTIVNSPTNSIAEYGDTEFSSDELEKAIFYYSRLGLDFNDFEKEGRLPAFNPLSKESSRISRALYFVMNARDEATLPIKIMKYCTVLECLFTSDSSEVTHKVSERFAHFLGKTPEERKSYFKLAKECYKIRSKSTHGQPVKESAELMKTLSSDIDDALRTILKSYFDDPVKNVVFNKSNDEYEKWFTDLILS